MNQFFKCLKNIAKKVIGGVAFAGVALVVTPIACGAVLLTSLLFLSKVPPAPPTPEIVQPKLKMVSVEPDNSQQQMQIVNDINDLLWRQIQEKYSPTKKTWKQEILESLAKLPSPSEKDVVEVQRSLPSEVNFKTPSLPCPNLSNQKARPTPKNHQGEKSTNTVETQCSLPIPSEVISKTPFPPCPDDLNNKTAWSVRKLQHFCRKLNSIELERNPSSTNLIEGHCQKGTNRRLIVSLIKKFYAHVS